MVVDVDRFITGFITALIALISIDCLRRLYLERQRFAKEDLNDYDLSLAWRIVIFLLYPIFNLLALWISVIACQWFGGYVKSMNYGLLWYQVIPDELASRAYLMPALFAGEVLQILLALLSLPALLFRPHPFLSTLIIYNCCFILAVNLIFDPCLSLLGFSSSHWQMAIAYGSRREIAWLAAAHLAFTAIFLIALKSSAIQMFFAKLSRPLAVEKLKKVLAENKDSASLPAACQLAMLYDATGFAGQARKQLQKLKKNSPQSLYTRFVEAYLTYRRRDYRLALKLFVAAAETSPQLSNELKSMFFAAAACCAHAQRDFTSALNLIERALEFDQHSSMARMVKVDVLLRQGKEQRAAEELQTALLGGLNPDLEQSIPIDWQKALRLISEFEIS